MKNRMFGDDQPDNPSPRTTIVGGRPPESAGKLPPVPTGLQRLLRLASVDEGFRAALLEKRSAIAAAAGVELVASERAVLDAAPAEQLAQMAASLPPPPTDRRTFLKEAAIAALTVVAGRSLQGCKDQAPSGPTSEPTSEPTVPRPEHEAVTKGITPFIEDEPRPDRPEMHTKGGAPPEMPPPRPDRPDMQTDGGAAPDEPPPRPPPTAGIRPDVPLPKPDAGPERPERPQPTRGIRVDVPPPKPEEK